MKVPPRTYKENGCKGTFYTRGKNYVIWYRLNHDRQSLQLRYSTVNRKIAADKIRMYENRDIYLKDNMPAKISELWAFWKNEIGTKKADKTIIATKNGINKLLSSDLRLIETELIRSDIKQRISLLYKNSSANTIEINGIEEKKIGARTINSYLRSLRAFFNFAVRNLIIPYNPITSDMFFKTAEKYPDVFTDKELRKIFRYWYGKDKEMYYFLLFLYLTAFRKNEGKNLKWEQVIYDDTFRELIILPKSKYGNIYDTFPLADNIKKILTKLDNYETKQNPVFTLKHIRNVSKDFDNSLIELNIPKHTIVSDGNGRGLHALRKTRITNWAVKDKLPLIVLEKLTRDKYNTLRKYYTNLDSQDYKKYI